MRRAPFILLFSYYSYSQKIISYKSTSPPSPTYSCMTIMYLRKLECYSIGMIIFGILIQSAHKIHTVTMIQQRRFIMKTRQFSQTKQDTPQWSTEAHPLYPTDGTRGRHVACAAPVATREFTVSSARRGFDELSSICAVARRFITSSGYHQGRAFLQPAIPKKT